MGYPTHVHKIGRPMPDVKWGSEKKTHLLWEKGLLPNTVPTRKPRGKTTEYACKNARVHPCMCIRAWNLQNLHFYLSCRPWYTISFTLIFFIWTSDKRFSKVVDLPGWTRQTPDRLPTAKSRGCTACGVAVAPEDMQLRRMQGMLPQGWANPHGPLDFYEKLQGKGRDWSAWRSARHQKHIQGVQK